MGESDRRIRFSDKEASLLLELVNHELSFKPSPERQFMLMVVAQRLKSPRRGHPSTPTMENLSELAYGEPLRDKSKSTIAAKPS